MLNEHCRVEFCRCSVHSPVSTSAVETNDSSDRSSGMPRLPWVLLVLLTGFGWVAPAQASTWDRVAEFLQIIQTTGVEALVADD